MARLGTPVVALVTTEFWEQGHFVAKASGMPAVPRVALPHPIASSGRSNMRRVADEAIDEIMTALTTGVTTAIRTT